VCFVCHFGKWVLASQVKCVKKTFFNKCIGCD
jgi:hypothetical protein